MLDFLSIHVPIELESRWTQIHRITKCILVNNPTIIEYWVHISRNSFYCRLSRLKLNNTNDIWSKLLTNNGDISVNEINEVYQFIRTSIHLAITDNNCTSYYYAQTKPNEDDKRTTTITLSSRLLQSDSYSFLFVAAAVLLRELTRAVWPRCLIYKDVNQYIRNPLFFSWTGMPVKLWPEYLKKQAQKRHNKRGLHYITHPSDGFTSLVADTGNLFQHVFYNGEVHLYEDLDGQNGQIITEVALKTHDTPSAVCAARYLDERFLNDFFNLHQCSLEKVRQVKDQSCPYYRYSPLKHHRGSGRFYLVVNNTPITQHWSSTYGYYIPSLGPCYEYKPYQ
ncbi:unnamed protein product [Rotaria socialis]